MEPVIQLQLENTSVCNARCHFCVYPTLERSRGFMAMDLYLKILREAETIDKIGILTLTGLGESLLDPHLEDRIRLAKAMIPRLQTQIFTNGTYLTPLRFEVLKDAGLNSLHVSLNATSAEQRRDIMQLDDWEKVISNIQYAMTHKGDMEFLVKSVSNGDRFVQKDVELLSRLWGNPLLSDGGGYFVPVVEGNWAGENRTVRDFKANEACGRALWQIYVTFDGKVTTCCFDPAGKQVFGDLKVQTLREVYSSDEYVKFRQAHFEDRADEYGICKGCTRI